MGTDEHGFRFAWCAAPLAALWLSIGGCDGASQGQTDTDAETDTEEPAEATGTASTSATSGPDATAATHSDDATSSGPASDDTTGSDDPDPSSDSDNPPASCAAAGLEAGSYADIDVVVDGDTRQYDLYVPASIDTTQPVPLVVNFHGYLNTPALQAGLSQFNAAADGAGVIVAYPRGIGQSWNGGQCCGDASASGVDDVAFARTLVNHVGLSNCIDNDRVFAIGMSNGGHLAHRLACEAADVFAGAASATGVLGLNPASCAPSRPVSMLQFHGTADAIVPYGGIGPGYPDVREMMQAWAVRNGCAPVPNVSFEMGDATCETWPACDEAVEVSLCTIEGAGHCWPGNPSCPYGTATTDVSANARILAMMSAQSL